MNKTLFVLRHAKSSWDDMERADFDRPLNPRGLNDARNMGSLLRDELRKIELIVSSPANRAIHTAILLSQAAEIPLSKISLNQNLYESYEATVDSIVKELPDDVKTAMIVGHNPTFTYFANMYIAQSIDNIPTTGIVRLSFGTDRWNDISRDNLITSFFDFPKNH